MAKINYQYEEPLPPDPASSGRGRLRILLLFVGVAAVTAAAIWFFIPSSKKAEKKSPETVQTPKEIPAETEKTPAEPPESAESRGSSTTPVDAGKQKPQGGSAETSPDNPAGSGDAEKIPAVPEVTPEDRVSVNPAKGKVSPLDPPDRGAKVAAPEAREGNLRLRLAEAAKLYSGKSYAQSASTAADVLKNSKENSALYREAGSLLGNAAFEAIRAGEIPETVAVHLHRVRSGDYLSRIAAANHTTVDMLMLTNHLKKSDHIRVGRSLKVVRGPWRIKVEKEARLLKLYNESSAVPVLFAVYDVGIGRFGKTPTASFVISARLRNPEWRTSDGRIYAHGDPENQLGNYFLKLAAPAHPGKPLIGYGIHGTPDESTVTKSLSNGCVRMRNADVEKIYLLVPVRTPVEITE